MKDVSEVFQRFSMQMHLIHQRDVLLRHGV
jgi:hypothetical protein